MTTNPSPETGRPRIAIVGGGISGLTAAHVLAAAADVLLLEADDRLGGHAHTHDVTTSAGAVAIDSGFIVHNERTYPTFLRLLAELGVSTQATEMSMSIGCAGCGLSYAGGRGIGGILAQPRRLADPRFVNLLRQVPRFHKAARAVLDGDDDGLSWGDFLARERFSPYFVAHFAVPLVACVWSASASESLAYPARHLFTFLDRHGMLTVTGSPTWRTIVGGSRAYVDALAARLPEVRTGAPVAAVQRHLDGVTIRLADGSQVEADRAVLAVHADQAARILVDASPEEKEALCAIPYSRNDVVLHRDASFLPAATRARASWNYSRTTCTSAEPVVRVDYWMNRLHGLTGVADHVVTLNPTRDIAPDAVVARMSYDHPVFTGESVRAARRLRDLGGPRLAFAGAHLGWGFHEDGARSGLEAARRLGGTW